MKKIYKWAESVREETLDSTQPVGEAVALAAMILAVKHNMLGIRDDASNRFNTGQELWEEFSEGLEE